MQFTETVLDGAFIIEPVPVIDERGSFARTFCVETFEQRGLETRFVQHSRSHSIRKGTLRGLHFQADPHAEVKLVSCSAGAVWDVIVDMRPASPTYLRWLSVVLTPANQRQILIPKGFAHGFQTLTDDAVVQYQISEFYAPNAARGLRYDEPALGIIWPVPLTVISARDFAWPLLEEVPA
ncbi:dTDP-4-dehydrorhamnose 3,5-epimerase [Aurantimonas sp. A2-1-M11]|uniref:dTDP-4-dehydrorhamnose 3,5-epimerase n=1 Tax=Aurantimonas sp. A2-1-M11 TaxID=3113712 RepID=UPI002F9354F4